MHALATVLIVVALTGGTEVPPAQGVPTPSPGDKGLQSQPPANEVSTEAPLPELRAFAAEVRRRWRDARRLQAHYTFIERREEVKLTAFGAVKEGPVKVYEVYPSPEPGNTYKRLIAVDGKPLSPAELEKNDRVHRENVLKRMNESPAEKAKRAREEAKERAEEERTLDELFRVYDIRLVRRERHRGHPTVVATFEPRPNYRPRTDEGKIMKKVRATAWIHETEYQIVRVEVEAIENIGVVYGVLGKIYKGTTGEFVRTKVNDEVWLPVRARLTARGRALVRKFDFDQVTEWSDYKKFVVRTEEAMR